MQTTFMLKLAIEEAKKAAKKGARQTFTNPLSASSRIEQLTPINFEHFRSQTCSGDASYGSWLHSCERPPLDAEYGLG